MWPGPPRPAPALPQAQPSPSLLTLSRAQRRWRHSESGLGGQPTTPQPCHHPRPRGSTSAQENSEDTLGSRVRHGQPNSMPRGTTQMTLNAKPMGGGGCHLEFWEVTCPSERHPSSNAKTTSWPAEPPTPTPGARQVTNWMWSGTTVSPCSQQGYCEGQRKLGR